MKNDGKISSWDPVAVVVDGETFIAGKEYVCRGRKYYYFETTPEQKERYYSILRRQAEESQPPEWRCDWNVIGMGLAEILAIFLTPEGFHPKKKDIDAVQKEILDLPFSFIMTVLAEITGGHWPGAVILKL